MMATAMAMARGRDRFAYYNVYVSSPSTGARVAPTFSKEKKIPEEYTITPPANNVLGHFSQDDPTPIVYYLPQKYSEFKDKIRSRSLFDEMRGDLWNSGARILYGNRIRHGISIAHICTSCASVIWGLPFMTSALRGEGGYLQKQT